MKSRRRVNSTVMSLSPITKQPRIAAQITFLPASEDGREGLPSDFSDGLYRPHVVVGDPNQRKALFVNNVAHNAGVSDIARNTEYNIEEMRDNENCR